MIPGDDDMIMTRIRGGGINKETAIVKKITKKKQKHNQVPLEKVNKRNINNR